MFYCSFNRAKSKRPKPSEAAGSHWTCLRIDPVQPTAYREAQSTAPEDRTDDNGHGYGTQDEGGMWHNIGQREADGDR